MKGRMFAMCGIGVTAISLMSSAAWAQQDAYVVTRPHPGIHATMPAGESTSVAEVPLQDHVQGGPFAVVDRQVSEPAAMVSRQLAEQPVFPHLCR